MLLIAEKYLLCGLHQSIRFSMARGALGDRPVVTMER